MAVVILPETETPIPATGSYILKTHGVMGGDACIRRMRIAVYNLVESRRLGRTDNDILADYPLLTPADLAKAWEYYAANTEEIDAAIAANNAD